MSLIYFDKTHVKTVMHIHIPTEDCQNAWQNNESLASYITQYSKMYILYMPVNLLSKYFRLTQYSTFIRRGTQYILTLTLTARGSTKDVRI